MNHSLVKTPRVINKPSFPSNICLHHLEFSFASRVSDRRSSTHINLLLTLSFYPCSFITSLTRLEFSFASRVSDRRSSSTRSSDDLKNEKDRNRGEGTIASSSSGGGDTSTTTSTTSATTTANATAAAIAKEKEEEDLNHESEVLDFGEFVVLEMLRLRRIDLDDLAR